MNRQKTKNIIWGIILILVAVGLVMYKMGMTGIMILPDISIWQIIFGLVFAYTLIDSISHVSFGGILFSLAFLCIVFQHQLHVEKLVPWTVLLVALLGTTALHLIFGNVGKSYVKDKCGKYGRYGSKMKNHGYHGMKIEPEETVDADVVNETVSFCGATKYIHSDNFQEAELNTSFCGAEFYFDKVNVPSGYATITINNRYAGLQIYVPAEWNVVNKVNSFFGSVEVDTRKDTDNAVNDVTVTLQGENRFGGVEVFRV